SQPVEVVDVSFSGKVISHVGNVGAFTDVRDVGHALRVQRYFGQHAVIASSCNGLVLLVDISAFYGYGDHVAIHAGTGGLQPIPGRRSLIDHLVPEAGLAVLIFRETAHQILQDRNQLRSLGIIGGQRVKYVDQCHSKPTHGAAPEFRRVMRVWVGPCRSSTLVIGVVEKTFG